MWPRLCGHTMSRLLPEFEKAKGGLLANKNITIEQEIECPRRHGVMTLHSEFDRLGYYCDECKLSLHLSH